MNHDHDIPDGSTLSKLPPELVVKILLELDWQSVLKAQQVCRSLNELVTLHKSIQYHIELGIAGMVDGSTHMFPQTGERLSRLKLYQSRWRKLSYAKHITVSVPKGNVWELASGVLAQGTSSRDEHNGRAIVPKLFFSQLPNDARGELKRKEWTFSGYEFPIRDFTIDPPQDLLVLLSLRTTLEVNAEHGGDDPVDSDSELEIGLRLTVQLHLRSLSTNEKHANAKTGTLTYRLAIPPQHRSSHTITVCQDKIGLLHTSSDGDYHQFIIWNWKEGQLLFALNTCYILSFSFLTDRHLLFAVGSYDPEEGDSQMRLVICDIEQTSKIDSSHKANAYAAIAELHLPPFDEDTELDEVLVRTDPPPCSLSGHAFAEQNLFNENAPFTVGPHSRLIVISISVIHLLEEPNDEHTLAIFVPLSTFLPYLRPARGTAMIPIDESLRYDAENSPTPRRDIAVRWEDWIPGGTRILMLPTYDPVWVCNVFGMKFVYTLLPGEGGNSDRRVVLLDFNAASTRRLAKLRTEGVEDDTVEDKAQVSEIITNPSTLEASRYQIFSCDVTTRLPYTYTCMRGPYKFNSVMVTEDSIILVKRDSEKEYGVLIM